MISIEFHHVVLFISGATALSLYFFLRKIVDFRSTTPCLNSLLQRSSQKRTARLLQVHPPPENETETTTCTTTDIDIIAIHGLDTDSQKTWTWKEEGRPSVNWLTDPDMLPQRAPRARIFTCDWPADLFEPSDTVQKTINELARLLLASIRNRPPATTNNRPIVFIASCLGGVILMKALVIAREEYIAVAQATRGIIFLATPFRGTSFQDIAKWAEPGLRAWAFGQNRNLSGLLQHVKPNFDLGELVRRFASFCRENELNDNVFTFYETGFTSLPRKVIPWLWDEGKPLVDQVSATLDFVPHPIALDRPHTQMNKFNSRNDQDYCLVEGQIETLLRRIHEGSPIEIAKRHMRTICYSKERVKIERLSGDQLPMDRCYINLTIVERRAGGSQSVDPSQQDATVTLPTLFQTHHRNKDSIGPIRRILIHGRAGVGKTTLCKKIVHDFTYGNLWSDLFDWVLWVPLRNLKLEERRRSAEYSFQDLFRHEYFAHHPKRDKLADALWCALNETRGARILFILDGLDEVSQDLEGNMLRFLTELLNQLNVIITARPNARLPNRISPIDLQLDTVGFLTDQTKAYIEHVFTDLETGTINWAKINGIQSFLNDRPLIQDLVRIPIQLDVLCYTWDDNNSPNFRRPDTRETMTGIYQRIGQALWRKDAQKMGIVAPSDIEDTHDQEIAIAVQNEQKDLEFLAFCGMYNDVIDFEPKHRGAISKDLHRLNRKFMPLDKMLGQVSFLRSSGSPSAGSTRNYHFLHLTFQEYFGALHFVRQWRASEKLRCLSLGDKDDTASSTTDFLRRNKYNPRYNVFWRFVAGLLTTETESRTFFRTIEQEPRDLLGLVHQKLVINCLSETSIQASHCRDLEERLVQLVLRNESLYGLTEEGELPITVMEKALQRDPKRERELLLLFSGHPIISESRAHFLARYLEHEDDYVKCEILGHLRGEPILEKHLQAVEACLESKFLRLRQAALYALAAIYSHKGQRLSKEKLQSIVTCFERSYGFSTPMHKWSAIKAVAKLMCMHASVEDIAAYMQHNNRLVREVAKRAFRDRLLPIEHSQDTIVSLQSKDEVLSRCAERTLSRQLLMEKNLQKITDYLQHENLHLRKVALRALGRLSISREHLQHIMALCLLDEPRWIRKAAEDTFRHQRTTTQEAVQNILPFLEHEKAEARCLALRTLEGRPLLREYIQRIALCLEDGNPEVREAALNTLRRQPLLEEYHPAIRLRFADVDPLVRRRAIELFDGRVVSTEDIQAIMTCFEDDDIDVIRQVGETLRSLPTKEYIPSILPYLQSPRMRVELYALTALVQRTLPEEVLQAVYSITRNRNEWTIREVIKVLKSQPNLPGDILEAIVGSLHRYTGISDRKVALEIIEAQPSVPTTILHLIGELLYFSDRETQWSAAKILCGQDLAYFPLGHVKRLYKILLSPPEHVTWQDIDEMSYITIGHNSYISAWPEGFKDAIQDAQKELGIPPPAPCIV
ncbi:ARM repeat-containing protein [Xylaria arbuscula]|nr:ARM repeat-containing protein [Xylaria arbuscula]